MPRFTLRNTEGRPSQMQRNVAIGNSERHMRKLSTFVLSTFLYASETWTLNKDLENRINAFELWIYRRTLKISYVDRITNEQVLHMVDEKEKVAAYLD